MVTFSILSSSFPEKEDVANNFSRRHYIGTDLRSDVCSGGLILCKDAKPFMVDVV